MSSRKTRTTSNSLRENGLSNINERELRRYRLFYKTYSGLGQVFSQTPIWGAMAPELTENRKSGTLSLQTNDGNISIAPEKLINSLSFTHIAELIEIEEPPFNYQPIIPLFKKIKSSASEPSF